MDEEFLQSPPLRPPFQNTKNQRDGEPDELEKLKQWQAERIERRLRGEYQIAAQRLGDLINTSLGDTSRIADVRVIGPTKTRSSFLASLITPHLSSEGPDTLEGALHRLRRISDTLHRTDIFADITASVDRSRAPLSGDNDVDLVFKVRDKPRVFVKGATETGNGEGSATATARVRNTFGGAETLEGSVSFGTRTRRAFQVRLEAPLTPSLLTRGEVSVFGLERDHSVFASSNEAVRGIKASVRTPSIFGMHELSYEAASRLIDGLTPAASVSMRESAGATIKSSISHTFIRDTRDNTITGTSGAYHKSLSEIAGLGGNAAFVKSETESQMARSFLPGMTLLLAARTGFLYPLFGKPTYFSDRFQLGGPTSIRMFRHNGLGPKDGVDSVGGELMWSVGASIISDIPRKPAWPLKTHLFVNAGRLDRLDTSKPLGPALKELVSKPSVSAGVGLIYRFDPIRVEVNFGVPLVAAKSDTLRRGIQVGIGLEFL